MFTGIIKSVGEVAANNGSQLAIRCPLFLEKPPLGASIAIDGVCLTVSQYGEQADTVGFELGEETRQVTLLATTPVHRAVNVEFALRLGDAVDGHMVQGHVDGLARLLSKNIVGKNYLLEFSLPQGVGHLLVKKGSIAINGVSLTINNVDDNSFFVCLVPFTIDNTSFKAINEGDLVHVETDIIGRYVYNFAQMGQISSSPHLPVEGTAA